MLRPNTEFHWNASEAVEELRATRDISQGEELTDCYLDLTVQVVLQKGGRLKTAT